MSTASYRDGLDEILHELWTVYYNKGLADDYYVAQSEAKHKIQALIDNKVLEGRVDELKRIPYVTTPSVRKYLNDRWEALTENKEVSDESV